MAYTVRINISRRLEELGERIEELRFAFVKYLRIGCVSIILPRLKAIVPVRTGTLRAARRFYPGQSRQDVGSFGWDASGFYWVFQRGLGQESQRIAYQLLPGVIQWALAKARAKVGV